MIVQDGDKSKEVMMWMCEQRRSTAKG